ncbi:hypothetical protein PFISCL1PPCAC_280, partial [Pristionchus fissidentatus]
SFCNYSSENRKLCLNNLILFSHYDGTEANKEFGTMHQLVALVRRCTDDKLRCIASWETIFRVVKNLQFPMPKSDGFRTVSKRLRGMIAQGANQITTDLGYRKRVNDTPASTRLRSLAIRMLVWAEDKVTIAEMERLGAGKIDKVEPALRMSVAAYAI